MNAKLIPTAMVLCIATAALHAEPLKLAATDINLSAPEGATLEQRAAAAERFILQHNPGFTRTNPGADALCNWLGRYIASPEKKLSGKYYDIGIANFNTLGIRRVMFAVEDIDSVVAHMRARGAQVIGEMQYGDTYRLAYIRGPEGIIVALAEQLS